MTARDLAAALDSVVQMLRERNLIKADGTTHPALDAIARMTATIYIQAQRNGRESGDDTTGRPRNGAVSGEVNRSAAANPVASKSPAQEGAPSQPPPAGDTSFPSPARRAPDAPESSQGPPREGDTHGEYTYHKCPACGLMKPYKKWWPKAKCWECWKKENPR